MINRRFAIPTLPSHQSIACLLAAANVFVLAASLHGADSAKPKTWAELIAAAKQDPASAEAIKGLTAEARAAVKKGLIRRAYKLEDVGKHRTSLDGRSKALEDEIRQTFALAMSDFSACNTLANELPTIAAAARITGDADLQAHVLAQLGEMCRWSPLQRPGWTLYAPGHRLGKDGKDGNWLATGCGVRAIVTTLEIMGDAADARLRNRLEKLLAREIAGVVDDWKTNRPWFVRSNNPVTNQWVLPTEGLVRACLFLGTDKHRDAYELGVTNLLEALSSHGTAGEFEEGIGYAGFTVTSLAHAARAMAVAGDRRAIDHPFLANYPTWAVLHIQPGRMTVNCFDAGNAQIPRDNANWRRAMSLLVFTCNSAAANWALWEQFTGPTNDLTGLMARVTGKALGRKKPPLFKAYQRAAMVVWRDSWADDATGVWIRGGHKLDQHDHQDRGHVNFIAGGRPILIEAGTPSYSNLDMGVHYASGAGHNVLQIGTMFPDRPYPVQKRADYPGWQRAGGQAPLILRRLDADGGSVLVDLRRCYAELKQWHRDVQWTAKQLIVKDDVKLADGKKDVILFRWHLGTGEEATITGKDRSFTVTWPDAEMKLTADQPLTVRQQKSPDATVTNRQDHQHTCVEVTSASPVAALELSTTIKPKAPATSPK